MKNEPQGELNWKYKWVLPKRCLCLSMCVCTHSGLQREYEYRKDNLKSSLNVNAFA